MRAVKKNVTWKAISFRFRSVPNAQKSVDFLARNLYLFKKRATLFAADVQDGHRTYESRSRARGKRRDSDMKRKMDRKRNRPDRSRWIAGIVVVVTGVVVIAILRGMFSGLGGFKEGIEIVRRECANEEEILYRATIVFLLRAQREVSTARSSLIERPDELGQPNIALGLAKIHLERAQCVASDTTLSAQIRRLTMDVGLARGEMAIAAKIAIKRLDRVRTEIDGLVELVEVPDTAGPAD